MLTLGDHLVDGPPHLLETQHLSGPFIINADGQADVSAASHRSTGTTIRCAAAHIDNVAAYGRVAAESLITIQIEEEITSAILNKLINNVRTRDVL